MSSSDLTFLFETPRLRVRPLRSDDVDRMFEVYGDPEAMKWVGDGQPISREQCARWIEITAEKYRKYGYGMAAAELKPDEPLAKSVVVGFGGLVHPQDRVEPEIKYTVRRAWWRQGFGSELAAGLMRYGREVLGLRAVLGQAYVENAASRRILEKAGLRYLETRTEPDGVRLDVLWWRAD